MSYTIFALKWRPKDFEEIVGQPHIVNTLKNALERKRLAHAYIFAGPRGVGKTSTARILAKALNCKNGPTIKPCGACPSCLEITKGSSFDVIEIDGASNRGIDEIRTLRESIKFSPTVGRYKIYIIDEVHMLTTEAFNALLKTLEEPPEFVKFIFATTHPDKVIPTVLSRCQRFDFRRIPTVETINQLEKIVKSENLNIDKEVLFAIAKASDGALRDAESILDQLVSFSEDRISLKDAVSVLGIVEQDVLFEITDCILHKDPREGLSVLNKVIDEGKEPAVFLNNLIEHFRNLMVAKITKADAKLIDLPEDFCQRLLKQSAGFSLEEIFSAFNSFINAQEMSKRLESIRIPLEIAVVKLSHDKKSAPEETYRSKEAKAPVIKKEEVKPVVQHTTEPEIEEPEETVEDEQSQSVEIVSLDEVQSRWQGIIEALSRTRISLATYLGEGQPLRMEKNTLIVGFPKNHSLHKESLESRDNKSLVEKTIFDMINKNIRVNFILSDDIEVKQEAREHPLIKSVMQAFGGRLISEG